jgi:hypothetical protein
MYNQIKVKFANAGSYSVSASYFCNSGGSSGTAYLSNQFVVYNSVTPTLSISSDKTIICGNGDGIVFTASATNGGSTPSYTWRVNGAAVSGQNASTFASSSLVQNDVVTATMYSVANCATPSSVNSSNSITVKYATAPSAQTIKFCDYLPPVLSVTSSSGVSSVKWYNQGGQLLGSGLTFPLPFHNVGSHQYQAEVVNGQGCLTTAKTPVTLIIESTAACDDKMNWIENVQYDCAPGGTPTAVAHNKTYFDDSGVPLQGQQKNLARAEVLATQTVADKFDRPVITTLPAPINSATFKFKKWFVTTASGELLCHRNLDNIVGKESGTVGGYYKNNNGKETFVAASDFPYSRMDYYEDGTGDTRMIAGPGEKFRLGQGHEALTGNFPVSSELKDYAAKTQYYQIEFVNGTFQNGTMGPWENFNPFATTSLQSWQWIYNGTAAADATSSGYANTMMIGQKRPGGLTWPAGDYTMTITAYNQSTGGTTPFASGLALWASDSPTSTATNISYTGSGTLPVGSSTVLNVSFTLDKDYSTLMFAFNKQGPNSGYRAKILMSNVEILKAAGMPQNSAPVDLAKKSVQTVTRDQNGQYAITFTDKSGRTIASAVSGTASDHQLKVTNYIDINSYSGITMWYFYLLEDQAVSFSASGGPSSYILEDLTTGLAYSPTFDGDPEWEAGFYRVVWKSGFIDLDYTNHYKSVSYLFYDDVGRVKETISPNGFTQLKQGIPLTDIDRNTYVYNHQGWLMERTEPDGGKISYKYRKDGKIRFSQNALQKQNEVNGASEKGKFSYSSYDNIGRVVESGEYKGGAVTFSSLNPDVANTFTQSEALYWVKTYYDFPATTAIPNLPAAYKQEYLRGFISWTENANCKTWYSYDEFGHVSWMAQKPTFLNKTLFTSYEYDLIGNLLTEVSTVYTNGTASNVSYHHFEYDADGRLSKSHTSPDGTDKSLRATYEYYLHGPVKRIVLGDNIQGIDFVYNIQGWLTQINHPDKAQDPGDDVNDAFGMILDYYESSLSGLFSATLGTDYRNGINDFHQLPELHQNNSLKVAQQDSRRNLFELHSRFMQLQKMYQSGSTALVTNN